MTFGNCVRPAKIDDMPKLLEMGRKFHNISPWSHLPFSAENVESTFATAIESETTGLFVTNDLSGMVGVAIAPVFFSDVQLAQELVWWSEKPGHGVLLLKAIEEWAKRRGAHSLSIARLSGIADEIMDKMYRRRGFSTTEIFYVKGLLNAG